VERHDESPRPKPLKEKEKDSHSAGVGVEAREAEAALSKIKSMAYEALHDRKEIGEKY
jgi:hypothetical protein